jgi:hypothetical protein
MVGSAVAIGWGTRRRYSGTDAPAPRFRARGRPRGSSSHHLRGGANGAKVDVAAATMRNFGSANRRPDVNARHGASSSPRDWCRNLYPNTAVRREPYIEVGYYACPERMCASIARFGFLNPILIDGQRRVIAGHARLEAARRLGLEAVPTLAIEGLSNGDLRLFAIAENRIAELAGWDKTLLAHELRFISELEIDVDLTLSGFAAAEIEILFDGLDPGTSGEADRLPAIDRGAGVELLSDAGEGDASGLEGLDDPGEVGERAGQPVDPCSPRRGRLCGR